MLDLEHLVGKLNYRYRAKVILPKIAKILKIKPAFAYLEIHVVDHCNLSCKGCGHFSPIADKWFADPDKYAKDMNQLKKLFSTIRIIRLMGGEPLLHPKIERFLFHTRNSFPKADIRIVTNGFLMNQMSDSFWEACKANSVSFDVTVYPPMKSKVKFIIELARSKGVKLTDLRKVDFFYAFYNNKGNSNMKLGYQKCQPGWNKCANLRNRKIYSCPISTYIQYFNKRFGTRIPSDGYVDIYTPNITGWEVKKALDKAPSTCRYCTFGWDKVPKFSWSLSNQRISDWDATEVS